MMNVPLTYRALGVLALTLHALSAQSSGTASISGRVLSEEGRMLRATVTLSFAGPRGFPAPPRRMLTNRSGDFTFSGLPAGRYQICAQVAASETEAKNPPYLDTCVWDTALNPVDLAAGQEAAGIVVTAPKGALLKIRVSDPDHVLPPVATAKHPAPLEPELKLMLKGPDNRYRHARLASAGPSGRDYEIVIPLKTSVWLMAASSVGTLTDNTGKEIKDQDDKDAIGVSAATQDSLAALTLTVRQKKDK